MLLVTGGLIHTPASPRGERADLLIDGDTLLDIVAPGSVSGDHLHVLRADRRLIIPGLVNSHTHGNGGLSKGIGDQWSLELLLNALPWVGASRAAEHKHLATLLNAVELVERGCTACYDLCYEFPVPTQEGMEAMVDAYKQVGLRAVIAPMVADVSFYRSIPGLIDALPEDAKDRAFGMPTGGTDRMLDALRSIARHWAHPSDRLRLGIAPTIPQHCTREFLIGCGEIAREHGLAIQSHISEPKYLSAWSIKVNGLTMTESMDAAGLVGPLFSAAHAVWLTDKDMALLAGKGAQVSHVPGANLRLGAGIAPVREYLRHGIAVGLGTDGAPSSHHQNMFEAMRAAASVSRVRGLPPADWVAAPEAFTMGTEGSARVLGMQDHIGKIAVGYKADLVLLDLDNTNYIPFNHATQQLVFTENGAAVDKVLIGGKLVVSGGRALGIDHAALAHRAQQAVERFEALNEPARQFAERIAPMVSGFCQGLADDEHMHRLRRDIAPLRCVRCSGDH